MKTITTLTTNDIPKKMLPLQRKMYASLRSQIAAITGESITEITERHSASTQHYSIRHLISHDPGYAYCKVAIEDLKGIPYKKSESTTYTNEPWGNRTISKLITPPGWTKEEHYQYCLDHASRYCGSSCITYKMEDGEVYEDSYYSVGD